MIKWYFDKFGGWLSKRGREFDLSDDKINNATLKDYWVLFKIYNSPVFWLFMFPLIILAIPFMLLFAAFELCSALVIVAAVFASPVSLYLIFNGQTTAKTILVAVISTSVLLIRYLIFPLVRRTEHYQCLKKRLLRV